MALTTTTDSSCITKGTKILMNDGSYIAVEDLEYVTHHNTDTGATFKLLRNIKFATYPKNGLVEWLTV